jgi:hypothetical protein
VSWHGDHLAEFFGVDKSVMTAATDVLPAASQQLCNNFAGIGFGFWHVIIRA